MTAIIMPSDIFEPRSVDEEFSWQAEQIKEVGGEITLVDLDSIATRVAVKTTLRQINAGDAFYRGWMLSLKDYSFMETLLRTKNMRMRTCMPSYQKAHHLPGWYNLFEAFTPETMWFSATRKVDLEPFKNMKSDAYIVKDYVKSRKNEWDTACFSPTWDTLPSIVNEFIRLQNEDGGVTGGIVVRGFENFDKNTGEARVWWVNGEPVFTSAHPDTPTMETEVDEYFLNYLKEPVKRLGNPFITTDIALNTDGQWRVVEVGDGQVSGLPVNMEAYPLWTALTK